MCIVFTAETASTRLNAMQAQLLTACWSTRPCRSCCNSTATIRRQLDAPFCVNFDSSTTRWHISTLCHLTRPSTIYTARLPDLTRLPRCPPKGSRLTRLRWGDLACGRRPPTAGCRRCCIATDAGPETASQRRRCN